MTTLGVIFRKGVISDVNIQCTPLTIVNVYVECARDELFVYIQGYICLQLTGRFTLALFALVRHNHDKASNAKVGDKPSRFPI